VKIVILVVCLSALSAALLAKDLRALARKERARREAVAASGRGGPSFDDADLARYRAAGGEEERSAVSSVPRPHREDERDLQQERRYWRGELERHRRELERIDAGIRRLELRLAERRGRRRSGERLSRDPSERLLEDTLESLRAERRRVEEAFRERARKAGAFPGWLR
jgi:hypothetical protein